MVPFVNTIAIGLMLWSAVIIYGVVAGFTEPNLEDISVLIGEAATVFVAYHCLKRSP